MKRTVTVVIACVLMLAALSILLHGRMIMLREGYTETEGLVVLW